jgi:hypothetical protein
LRGQPRIYLSKQTDRIPLVSPFGHYRSRTWHRIATASIAESESHGERLANPFSATMPAASSRWRTIDNAKPLSILNRTLVLK